jgi:uncharacterized membrane protein YqhA
MRRLFAASRFVVALAVIATFLGSALLLVMATLTVIRLIWVEVADFTLENLSGHHVDRLGVQFIQITDIILLGTVLYIVSLGIYQLFIDHTLPLPRWLVVDDLNDLKRLLIGVTVVLLGVTFLGDVVEGDGESDLLPLGLAIALVIASLGFILWVHPNEPPGRGHAANTPPETGPATEERPPGAA